jgi:hypothetical protein
MDYVIIIIIIIIIVIIHKVLCRTLI